jgi:hypothetical protein
VKDRDHLSLWRQSEIDEEVSTQDDVDLGERRIVRDILAREHAALSQSGIHAVSIFDFDEEPLELLGGELGGDRLRIEAYPRPVDHSLTDVGPEDLNVGHITPPLFEVFDQRHRQRIGLLAG